MINIDNKTNQELLSLGFTMSHILTLRSQCKAKTKSTPDPTNRVIGFTGSLEEGIQTVLSRKSGLSDLKVINELHALKVQLNEKERLEVSFKLLNMFKEGKLTRVKNRVFEYSLA